MDKIKNDKFRKAELSNNRLTKLKNPIDQFLGESEGAQQRIWMGLIAEDKSDHLQRCSFSYKLGKCYSSNFFWIWLYHVRYRLILKYYHLGEQFDDPYLLLFFVCLCVHACLKAWGQFSGVDALPSVGSGDRSQVLGLSAKCLYLLSHPASLIYLLFEACLTLAEKD